MKELTVVVADTGEFSQIPQFKPQDVTTNPSLIYKASQVDEYKHLVQEAVDYAKVKPKQRRKCNFFSTVFFYTIFLITYHYFLIKQ